jgi:hypothetical protein
MHTSSSSCLSIKDLINEGFDIGSITNFFYYTMSNNYIPRANNGFNEFSISPSDNLNDSPLNLLPVRSNDVLSPPIQNNNDSYQLAPYNAATAATTKSATLHVPINISPNLRYNSIDSSFANQLKNKRLQEIIQSHYSAQSPSGSEYYSISEPSSPHESGSEYYEGSDYDPPPHYSNNQNSPNLFSTSINSLTGKLNSNSSSPRYLYRTKRKRYTHITSDVNDSPIIDPKLLIDPSLPKKERNKISATAYRKRRRVFLDGLEGELNEIKEELTQQQNNNKSIQDENSVLKEQLALMKNLITSNPSLSGMINNGTISLDDVNSEASPNNTQTNYSNESTENNVRQASIMLFSNLSMCLYNPSLPKPNNSNNIPQNNNQAENGALLTALNRPMNASQLNELISIVQSGGNIFNEAICHNPMLSSNENINRIVSEVYSPLVSLFGNSVVEEALRRLTNGVWSDLTGGNSNMNNKATISLLNNTNNAESNNAANNFLTRLALQTASPL